MKKIKVLLLAVTAFLAFTANAQLGWGLKDNKQLYDAIKSNSVVSASDATLIARQDSILKNAQYMHKALYYEGNNQTVAHILNDINGWESNNYNRLGAIIDNTAYNGTIAGRLLASGSNVAEWAQSNYTQLHDAGNGVPYLAESNIYLSSMQPSTDTIENTLKRIERETYGADVTPATYGGQTWGEVNSLFEQSNNTLLNSLNTTITNGANVAAASIPVVLATDVSPTVVTTPNVGTGTTVVHSFSLTPASTASIIALFNPVNAYLDKVTISGTQTTGGNVLFKLLSCSTAPTGGSINSSYGVNLQTGAQLDINTVNWYTANPTIGTMPSSPTAMARAVIPIPAPASVSGELSYTFDYTNMPRNKQPKLTSTRVIVLSMEGVTLTGGVLNVSVQYTYY